MQSLYKLSSCTKPRPLRVMVLGMAGVGKTALTVRFVTRRFIGEYDPSLERVYNHHTVINSHSVNFEILDSAGQSHETERLQLEANMRWADAFVLMYSVTDKCSFDECNRLRFLISYNKRRRRLGSVLPLPEAPVLLVGNKTDQLGDRMVSRGDGKRRARDIGCTAFHEISVRESVDDVAKVFQDVHASWLIHCKAPKLKRSTSDLHHGPISLDAIGVICGNGVRSGGGGNNGGGNNNHSNHPFPPPWLERALESGRSSSTDLGLFRERASTDGQLHAANKKIAYQKVTQNLLDSPRSARRMSISLRGSATSS